MILLGLVTVGPELTKHPNKIRGLVGFYAWDHKPKRDDPPPARRAHWPQGTKAGRVGSHGVLPW